METIGPGAVPTSTTKRGYKSHVIDKYLGCDATGLMYDF